MTTKHWLIGGGILAAALVAGYAYQAKAADLGGSCCADLEERVAELEATVARKGNRKVTLKISGQVSKALLYISADGDNAHGVIDNVNSPSRLTFSGEAKLDKGWSAGFVIEIGVGSPDDASNASYGITSALYPYVPGLGEMYVRHNAVWLGTPIGKVWLGHTSTATDGIVEINLANVNVVALPAASWLGFDGGRTQVVKYQSQSLAGFEVSASMSDALSSDTTSWDAALRYAGEFGGIRVAAGIGYADNGADVTRVSGSASIMHVASGLFLSGNAGRIDGGADTYGATGGIEKNWFGIGKTTLFGEYSKSKDVMASISPLGITKVGPLDDVTVAGFGVVQSIDALSMDLFASYRNVDVEGSKADVFFGGMRVSF